MRKHIPFLLACIFFLLLKGKVFFDFALIYADHDQCTLWNAAVETSQGNFHEPCFYGQSYNSNLEAWLAAPLLLIHVPVEFAVPLITSIMACFIFLLPAIGNLRKGNTVAAWCFLLIGFLIAADAQLIMSMPRGFINGIFVVVMGYFFYLISENKWKQFVLFLAISLGFWINPNSVMLSVPIVLFDWWQSREKNWIMAIGGGIVGIFYKVYTLWFYASHPLYDYHKKKIFAFEWAEWTERLQRLDHYFFNKTWLFAAMIVISFFFFLRDKKYRMTIGLIIYLLFFFITLATERVGDGMQSIYYHQGRMYLALPVAFALIAGVSLEKANIHFHFATNMGLNLLCLALLFLGLRNVDQRIAAEFNFGDHGVVVEKVERIKARFNRINEACAKQNIDLVVYAENCKVCWIDTYAIPALSYGKIETINLREDRRGWRFEEEMYHSDRNCLVMSCSDSEHFMIQDNMLDASEFDQLTSCYYMHTNTNIPDHFRPMLKQLRYGY